MDDFENSARALSDFADGPALQAADDLARVFDVAGDRIAASLERAARRGELSFNALAGSIAQDLTRLTVDQFITGPITDALSGALGGFVGGAIGGSSGGRNTTVNLNVSGMDNPQGLQRSQGQISAAVARAVASGQRYI